MGIFSLLFGETQEERNEENNAAYADGVRIARTERTPMTDYTTGRPGSHGIAGAFMTEREREVEECRQKGYEWGCENPEK